MIDTKVITGSDKNTSLKRILTKTQLLKQSDARKQILCQKYFVIFYSSLVFKRISTEGTGSYDGNKLRHPVTGGEPMEPQSSIGPSGAMYTPFPSGLSIHHWPSESFR
mmetsp:Transcript_3448/g.7536  ORF Transcript_3448/g.7536 Transcript_3448/m.7536 type:complete len:108 (-) Transcript_3448:492-815(-)